MLLLLVHFLVAVLATIICGANYGNTYKFITATDWIWSVYLWSVLLFVYMFAVKPEWDRNSTYICNFENPLLSSHNIF